jgi:PAS domain S-box-containing protein
MNTSFNQNPSTVDPASETVQQLQRQIEQLERCLDTRDARNRQLMAAMPQIVWMAKADGSIIDFNYRWYEYTGLAAAESLYWGFLKAVHPEDGDRIRSTWQQAQQNRQPYTLHCRLLATDGTHRWFKGQAEPLLSPEGELLEWVGTYTPLETDQQPVSHLQQKPEFLQALLENLSDGIVACDADGVLNLFNRATQDFHGLPPEPLPADEWASHYDLYLPDGKTPLCKEQIPLFRALNGESVRNVEMMIIPKQGKTRTLLASGNAIINAAGEKLGAVVVMRDITERKQAEAKIQTLNAELEQRVSERTAQLATAHQLKDELLMREQAARSQAEVAKARYRDLVNGLGDAIVWESDPVAEQFLFVSQSAEQLLGYPVEQWLTQPNFWATLIHPDDYGWVTSFCHQTLNQVQDHELEYRCIASDGRIVWLRDRTYVVRNADGSVQKLRGLMINVTQRKQAELEREQAVVALQESEKRFRSMADKAPVMIWMADKQGYYTFLNQFWLSFTGRPLASELGQGWQQGVYPDDLPTCIQIYESAFKSRAEFRREYRLRRADGQYRWILETGIPRFTRNHKFTGYIGSCIDISDRKLAEEALRARADELARMATVLAETNAILEKRNEELDQFAYVTSHDLKAPLRAIANLSQWIEEDIQDQLTDETRHQMSLLRGRVHRMEALINGLLQYSRAGRLNMKSEWVNVEALLTEIIDSLAPPPEFQVAIAPNMPTLLTESLPLQQVFTNLISNAIKHHHRQDGKVNISQRDQGEAYEFAVTDDGPGISPDYHEKIFVIFQTLQARDKVENTGVGLALVKKIVESKGGKIQLDSTEGRGATFRFTWPKKGGLVRS